jgi:hypothetical protein
MDLDDLVPLFYDGVVEGEIGGGVFPLIVFYFFIGVLRI